ncbi:hypothetical protein C8Q80DRAFT_166751 [Daedaleopsis nitida]|nr:hypothetical protein C8Q80DRAFT_166751 [Daedaleopsis nitida]
MPAHRGHWCAFYPDIPHQVKEINRGYRAVIAFNLFHESTAGRDTTTSSECESKLRSSPASCERRSESCSSASIALGRQRLRRASPPIVEDPRGRRRCSPSDHGDVACRMDGKRRGARSHVLQDASIPFRSRAHRDGGRHSCWRASHGPSTDFGTTRPAGVRGSMACRTSRNEVEAWLEDSVYLSYAVLVLLKDRESVVSDEDMKDEEIEDDYDDDDDE